jgi:hypothetical protein
MMVVGLAACRMLEDPVFPAPAEGYVVTFVAFYEQWFSAQLHRFLPSLLRQYGLEMHNPNPSGVLHFAAFTTLCEGYMGD